MGHHGLKSLRPKEKLWWTPETQTLRGKYLKTGPLRFFWSENKKSPKKGLLSDNVLKNYAILIFDHVILQKLFFFLRPHRKSCSNNVQSWYMCRFLTTFQTYVQNGAHKLISPQHWIRIEKLPKNNLLHVEICPLY